MRKVKDQPIPGAVETSIPLPEGQLSVARTEQVFALGVDEQNNVQLSRVLVLTIDYVYYQVNGCSPWLYSVYSAHRTCLCTDAHAKATH